MGVIQFLVMDDVAADIAKEIDRGVGHCGGDDAGWVRQQETVDHHAGGGWLDELWCQGGLTIDLDHRRLTWFDMPTGNDLVRRAVVVDLLARTWPGWTVTRADRGVRDLAATAGVSVERVRHPDVVELITATVARDVALREKPSGSGRWCPAEQEARYCLVMVARGDDLAVSLVVHACHAAWLGSAVAAVREFVAELTHTHGPDRVHPAIQALDALTAVFGDVPPGVNPAIADHHPVGPTTEELVAAAEHVGELVRSYDSGGGGPRRR